MKKSILLLPILFVLISGYSQNAYIQVISEPGVSVFLDNSFKGETTSEMGGLIIEEVSAGSRSIKVVKDGFNPQEERITVKSGEVYSYKVRPFIPKLKISETGNTGQQEIDLKVGNLKIQSLPVAINIIIPSLGIDYSKSKDEWNVEEVPVGSYPATFKGINKTLNYTIEIKNNQLTHLLVNTIRSEVEDRGTSVIGNTYQADFTKDTKTVKEATAEGDSIVAEAREKGNQLIENAIKEKNIIKQIAAKAGAEKLLENAQLQRKALIEDAEAAGVQKYH